MTSLKRGFASTRVLLSITLRTYARAKTGSTPLDVPAIMLIVPVGAMVVVVALRRGGSPFSAYSDLSKFGKAPRSSASTREASFDASCMVAITCSATSRAFSEL